jgi:hypothetical protein
MAAILQTSDADLWAILGVLVTMISTLAWWNRHDRQHAIADRPGLENERSEDFGLQDEGWQY